MIGCDNENVKIPFDTHHVMIMLYNVPWNGFISNVLDWQLIPSLKGDGSFIIMYTVKY